MCATCDTKESLLSILVVVVHDAIMQITYWIKLQTTLTVKLAHRIH